MNEGDTETIPVLPDDACGHYKEDLLNPHLIMTKERLIEIQGVNLKGVRFAES